MEMVKARIRVNEDGSPMCSGVTGPTGTLVPGEVMEMPKAFFDRSVATGVAIEEAKGPAPKVTKKRGAKPKPPPTEEFLQ